MLHIMVWRVISFVHVPCYFHVEFTADNLYFHSLRVAGKWFLSTPSSLCGWVRVAPPSGMVFFLIYVFSFGRCGLIILLCHPSTSYCMAFMLSYLPILRSTSPCSWASLFTISLLDKWGIVPFLQVLSVLVCGVHHKLPFPGG